MNENKINGLKLQVLRAEKGLTRLQASKYLSKKLKCNLQTSSVQHWEDGHQSRSFTYEQIASCYYKRHSITPNRLKNLYDKLMNVNLSDQGKKTSFKLRAIRKHLDCIEELLIIYNDSK